MGAVESSPLISPTPHPPGAQSFLQPGRALHTLLHIVQPLPSDPDDPFYTVLFRDYVLAHHVSPRALSQLTTAALNLPSGTHAVALVAALRAAIHRLRSDETACRLGALLLARSALADLRSAAPDDPVCLVLGAGDAERSLCPADRIDLGKSLVARLVTAALDILHKDDATAFPHVALAAIDLLLVVLADELYARPARAKPLSHLLDRYAHPEAVVTSLLDVIADASTHVDPSAMLSIGTEHTLNRNREAKQPTNVNLNLGVSASALVFKSGFTDAISAISSRLTFPAFSNDPSGQNSQSHTHSPKRLRSAPFENMYVPDPHSEPYAPFGAETPPLHPTPSAEFDVDLQLVMNNLGEQEKAEQLHSSSQLADSNPDTENSPRRVTAPESNPEVIVRSPTVLAEHALVTLCILCGPRPNSPYRRALCELQNKSTTEEMVDSYSFSKLYETLGKWLPHPNTALLTYYLITGNRRFQTFALARTDPDVLVVPLMASLKRRCCMGVAPADAYIPAAIMLTLTSDKGFCEAIDEIKVAPAWLGWIADKGRLGNEDISISGVVLLVCSRVVQQSLVVRRREPECFLASVCLGIMANVSGDVTSLHSFAAERLVSLLEFLGRRRRKALVYAKGGDDMPMVPPRIRESPRLERHDIGKPQKGPGTCIRNGSFGKSDEFLERMTEYVGLCLELIVSVLRSRSSVSANRHLVYTLLHRETLLENEFITNGSDQTVALSHMLRRMVEFFGRLVEEWCEESVDNYGRRGSPGISVERVFEVIEENARHLRGDTFEGLPEIRFSYEVMEAGQEFLQAYSWSLATRRINLFCKVDKMVMPITLPCFRPSQ